MYILMLTFILRDIYEMKYEVMRMAGDFHGSD